MGWGAEPYFNLSFEVNYYSGAPISSYLLVESSIFTECINILTQLNFSELAPNSLPVYIYIYIYIYISQSVSILTPTCLSAHSLVLSFLTVLISVNLSVSLSLILSPSLLSLSLSLSHPYTLFDSLFSSLSLFSLLSPLLSA